MPLTSKKFNVSKNFEKLLYIFGFWKQIKINEMFVDEKILLIFLVICRKLESELVNLNLENFNRQSVCTESSQIRPKSMKTQFIALTLKKN